MNIGDDWSIKCRTTAVNQQWTAKWQDPNGNEIPILSNRSCASKTSLWFVALREGRETVNGNNKQFKELTLHLCNVKESFAGSYTCSVEGGESRSVSFEVIKSSLASHDNGGIIGAVIAIVVLLIGIAIVIVLVAIVMVHSHRKNHSEFDVRDMEDVDSKQGEPPQMEHAALAIPFVASDSNAISVALGLDERWQYPSEKLHILRDLGSGEFGKVCLVRAPGILCSAPHKSLAAAKTVKGVYSTHSYKCF